MSLGSVNAAGGPLGWRWISGLSELGYGGGRAAAPGGAALGDN